MAYIGIVDVSSLKKCTMAQPRVAAAAAIIPARIAHSIIFMALSFFKK
jgi:hypothetical protein